MLALTLLNELERTTNFSTASLTRCANEFGSRILRLQLHVLIQRTFSSNKVFSTETWLDNLGPVVSGCLRTNGDGCSATPFALCYTAWLSKKIQSKSLQHQECQT